MNKTGMLLLNGDEVIKLLEGREQDVLHQVRLAHKAHADRESFLPQSSFVRFPSSLSDRIIALPAFLGGPFQAAGIKWIASFPNNIEQGKERASAVLILNSIQTGFPVAIMEGSTISAKRTAATAAIAANYLLEDEYVPTIGVVGCGLINFESVRFLLASRTGIKSIILKDLSSNRANRFREKCLELDDSLDITVESEVSSIFKATKLISIATTATQPYIFDISSCQKGTVILHTSLRDLAPEVILSVDNVVDDIEHIFRAQTSVHLAEQEAKSRKFVRCTLGDMINGNALAKKNVDDITVFSPFGLGVLDLAVGKLVYSLALSQGHEEIKDFFPSTTW